MTFYFHIRKNLHEKENFQVPQQRNDVECGNFVLYYINLFIEGAPENFSIEGGYPYFVSFSSYHMFILRCSFHILSVTSSTFLWELQMKKNWFTPEGLECFCQQLYSSSE